MQTLRRHQFPPSCHAPGQRFLVADDYTRAGFGSAMWFWRGCLVLALNENRVMVASEKRTRAAFMEHWSSCTKCDAERAAESSQDPLVIKRCEWGTPAWTGQTLPEVFKHLGHFWWFVHGFAFLAQPRATFVKDLGEVASLHVRRGDKVREAAIIPVRFYLADLEAALPNFTTRTVLLVSDEPENVKAEAEQSFVSNRNVTFDINITKAPEGRSRYWSETDDHDIAHDLGLLQVGEPIALSLTTNFGQVGMSLKIAADLRSRRPGTVVLTNPTIFSSNYRLVRNASTPLGVELTFGNPECHNDDYASMRASEEGPCCNKPLTFAW
eukprot:CAMPEP_0170624006 /NCGR_PEP_ID=MMETSP0224-20130122/30000_1 /TAXON_ID=285029 /ORGANISM="Togula jolla, Strain CCCM 725" /LENGTH=324 /DNA_ID=CAMNT_0010950495 /DNA_START=322 /DNA_END=1293 /DNA_ORIENTATION=-